MPQVGVLRRHDGLTLPAGHSWPHGRRSGCGWWQGSAVERGPYFTQYRIAILFRCGTLDFYPVGYPSRAFYGLPSRNPTVAFPNRITHCGPVSDISVRDVSGVVARTRATPHAEGNAGWIRLVGVVLLKHGIKHRRMFVRAPWRMPMNRVIRQEAHPLERVESVTGPNPARNRLQHCSQGKP